MELFHTTVFRCHRDHIVGRSELVGADIFATFDIMDVDLDLTAYLRTYGDTPRPRPLSNVRDVARLKDAEDTLRSITREEYLEGLQTVNGRVAD